MSITSLKIIAAVTMVLDHCRYFFTDLPVAFSWLGRISAPIFLYCSLYSLEQTSNQQRYFKRLYLSGVGMSFIQCITGFEGNFFRTIFLMQVLIELFYHNDQLQKKITHPTVVFWIWQLGGFLLCVICGMCNWIPFSMTLFVLPALLGNVFCIEGGFFLILGLLMYRFRNNKKETAICYIAFCICYSILSLTPLIPITIYFLDVKCGLSMLGSGIEYLFENLIGLPFYRIGAPIWTENYQWMMIFALPFLMLYKEKTADRNKITSADSFIGWIKRYYFYILYPAHIFIIYLVSRIAVLRG